MSTTQRVTTQDFQTRVLESQLPVLVDFWADWCGPCKSLAPVLDKLAAEYADRLLIAKVNVDEEQQIAAAIGIRSLPTLLLFVNGRPVEQIVGAQPEANIRAVIDRFVDAAGPADQADAGGPGAEQPSLEKLQALLAEEPDNLKARTAIAQIQIVNGDLDAAQATLAEIDPANTTNDDVRQVTAALAFARLAGDPDELRRELDMNPKDLALRCRLAAGLVAAGDHDGAAEQLLEVIRRNKTFDDGAGRRLLLQLLDLLGPKDPRVTPLRRRLMSALY